MIWSWLGLIGRVLAITLLCIATQQQYRQLSRANGLRRLKLLLLMLGMALLLSNITPAISATYATQGMTVPHWFTSFSRAFNGVLAVGIAIFMYMVYKFK